MSEPPNIAQLQFIDCAVTGVAGGQKLKKVDTRMYAAAKTLTGSPILLIVQGP